MKAVSRAKAGSVRAVMNHSVRAVLCSAICCGAVIISCGSDANVRKDAGKNAGRMLTVPSEKTKRDLLSYFGEKSYEPGGREFEGREWKNGGPRLKVSAKLTVTQIRKFPDSAVYRMSFVIQPMYDKYPSHEAVLYFLVDHDDAFGLLKEEAESHSDLSAFDDRSRLRCSRSSSEFAEGLWHSTVRTDAAVCEYSSEHPSGHYSVMKWENNRGLVEYSFGYGSERDALKLKAK